MNADQALEKAKALSKKLEITKNKNCPAGVSLQLFLKTKERAEKELVWAINDISVEFYHVWNEE